MEYPITDQRCVNQVFKGCQTGSVLESLHTQTFLLSYFLHVLSYTLLSPYTLPLIFSFHTFSSTHPPHTLLSHPPPHTLLFTPSLLSHPPHTLLSHPPLHTLLFTPSSSHPPSSHPPFSHPNTRHIALQKFVICPLASQQGQRHYTSSSKVHHFSMSCDVT